MASHGNYRHGKGTSSNRMQDLLRPADGHRERLRRGGRKPKDHMRENYANLRAAQESHRRQREEEAQAGPELFKMQQFSGVESKVAAHMRRSPEELERQRRAAQASPRSRGGAREQFDDDDDANYGGGSGGGEAGAGGGSFLLRGEGQERRAQQAQERRRVVAQREHEERETARQQGAGPETPRKPAVPRAKERAALAPKSDRDFVAANRHKARTMTPSQGRDNDDTPTKHDSYGRVPEYLRERQQRWAEEEEERRANLPDPDCPEGMRRMPEAERVETLEQLRRTETQLNEMLIKMPIAVDTLSSRRRKDDIERKLGEVQSAIEVFDKPKVFIADPAAAAAGGGA